MMLSIVLSMLRIRINRHICYLTRMLTAARCAARQCQQEILLVYYGPQFIMTERERENYAEKGGNPFLHMLREWTLT